jgi:hypothetical protein
LLWIALHRFDDFNRRQLHSIADSFNRQQPGKSSQNLADESCTQIDLSLRFAVANFEKTSTPQY